MAVGQNKRFPRTGKVFIKVYAVGCGTSEPMGGKNEIWKMNKNFFMWDG